MRRYATRNTENPPPNAGSGIGMMSHSTNLTDRSQKNGPRSIKPRRDQNHLNSLDFKLFSSLSFFAVINARAGTWCDYCDASAFDRDDSLSPALWPTAACDGRCNRSKRFVQDESSCSVGSVMRVPFLLFAQLESFSNKRMCNGYRFQEYGILKKAYSSESEPLSLPPTFFFRRMLLFVPDQISGSVFIPRRAAEQTDYD